MIVSIPSRESALLRPPVVTVPSTGGRFQSLPGNLPFCGRLSLQRCIFRLIAPNARASPPKVSKSHRSIGSMSVSYPIKLWHVNRFFISECPRSIS